MTISNGPILVDCTGIDIMSSQSVTIEGLYAKLLACAGNPSVYLTNLKFSGLIMTPSKVAVTSGTNSVTATIYRACTITVTSADVVTTTFF